MHTIICTIFFQADVITALQKVCGLLSSDIREECKSFVAQYGEDIIDLLINEVDPQQVCSKLTLCKVQLVVQAS